MSFRRRSTTTSGLTLIELIVSMGIFAGIMALSLLLLNQNQRAAEKSIAQADASATVLILFEKIRAEMRTGRIIGNDPPEILDYWIHQRNADGTPIFGGPHGLAYLPGPSSDPDVARLSVDEGRLVRDFQGEQKILAGVGKDGLIQFEWSPGNHLLYVNGQVNDPFEEPRANPQPRPFRFVVSLNNIE